MMGSSNAAHADFNALMSIHSKRNAASSVGVVAKMASIVMRSTKFAFFVGYTAGLTRTQKMFSASAYFLDHVKTLLSVSVLM